MNPWRIGVIAGSLRRVAYSRSLARTLFDIAPATLALSMIEIGDLPLYNQDLETDSPPAAWTRFRNEVISSDAVLFVTPEYNRSIPGALKNALDVGSRPRGKSAWSGKPAGVMSITPGALGAMAAHHHLRQVLCAVNLAAMPHPEVYLPNAAKLFDSEGRLANDDTRAFLAQFFVAFEAWVSTFSARV